MSEIAGLNHLGVQQGIAVLATLDTKREEALYLAGLIEEQGLRPYLVDLSLSAEGVRLPERDGPRASFEEETSSRSDLDKSSLLGAAAQRAAAVLSELVSSDQIQGVIGLGGGTGTWLVGMAVQRLPIGLPKILVSTIAGRISADVLGISDIVVVPSLTDIAGLNPILRQVLHKAAAAVCAMSRSGWEKDASGGQLVAMTMFGVTTKGGTTLRMILEALGLEVAIFHANGVGGQMMEELVAEGSVSAVLDFTTTELIDEIAGGRCSAGPDRLTAAGARGIPQLVVPGAMDVINGGPPADLATSLRGRLHHMHRPNSVLIRSNLEENRRAGSQMALKLNKAKGPVRIVVPMEGFSALDCPGGPFEDAGADGAFLSGLRGELRRDIEVEEVQANINDQVFAEHCGRSFLDLLVAGGLMPVADHTADKQRQ
jgi:uncharacterized protein (UPF0261 family)